MSGFIVMWTCYCSDAGYDPASLPETCPEHDSPRMAEPWPNTMRGGVSTGHRCWTDEDPRVRTTADATTSAEEEAE